MHTDSDNSIFELAASFVRQTNRPIFLTGKAGTGKTTFLKYIQQNCTKKMAVVAPTGVAAINAGGVTIHSMFMLPIGTYIHNFPSTWGESDTHIFNRNQLLSKLRLSQNRRDLMRELELLIIDEISMVRADVLDAVDTVLRSVRRRLHEPFGGVQVLYIGDLFQLPPIVRQQEKSLMDSVYNSPFFFDALAAKADEPLCIELKKIYRQKDDNFIRILNNIRNNEATQDDLDILHECYDPYFEPLKEEGYITITSHNYQADDINRRELDKLSTLGYQIEAEVEREFPETAFPTEKVLRIKEGAQIMFIKNDKGDDRRFYNGKIGWVEQIKEDGQKILVRFKDEEELLELEKEQWKNVKYKYDEEDDEIQEEVLGSFKQYPIRLAWAITIHKSQGLTFERAIVDAGQSFAPGQVYVALSRLTGLSGLVLRSRITPQSIMTDERIIAFSNNKITEDTLKQSLKISQKDFVTTSLLNAFNFEKLYDQIQILIHNTNFKKLADGDAAMLIINQVNEQILPLKQNAEKFFPQLQSLLDSGAASYSLLQERVSKAVPWFESSLDTNIIAVLRNHIQEWRVKSRTKKYTEIVRVVLLFAERKKIQLQQALLTVEGIVNPDKWEQAIEAVSNMNNPGVLMPTVEETVATSDAPTKPSKGLTKVISYELFQEGKSIDEIAKLRSLASSTILGHLAEFVGLGVLAPQQFMSDEKLEMVLGAFKENPNMLHAEMKMRLGDDYTYAEIKIGHQYLKYLETKMAGT